MASSARNADFDWIVLATASRPRAIRFLDGTPAIDMVESPVAARLSMLSNAPHLHCAKQSRRSRVACTGGQITDGRHGVRRANTGSSSEHCRCGDLTIATAIRRSDLLQRSGKNARHAGHGRDRALD